MVFNFIYIYKHKVRHSDLDGLISVLFITLKFPSNCLPIKLISVNHMVL